MKKYTRYFRVTTGPLIEAIKECKEITTELKLVKTKNISTCLKAVGLYAEPLDAFITGGFIYRAKLVVITSDPLVAFVIIPWYAQTPEMLGKFKADLEEGSPEHRPPDTSLWQPTPEMTEIKGWEYMKAIQEWNDSLGMEEKYA